MAERPRNWNVILYPESLPDNWIELLDQMAVPIYVSPLHDKDVDLDGKKKKPHYHSVWCFGGHKSREQVLEMVAPLGTQVVEPNKDLGGSLRYFCHMDSVGKAKYDPHCVMCFGGADYLDGITCVSQNKKTMKEIMIFIEKEDVRYYSDLCFYASFYQPEWYALVNNQSVYWCSYLKSRTDKKQKSIYNNFSILIEGECNES